MKKPTHTFFFGLCLMCLSCSIHNTSYSKSQAKVAPAKIEKIEGSSAVSRVTLTSQARARLGIKSQTFPRDRNGRLVIPMSSLLYDTNGISWVFVETEPSVFHREQIQVISTQGSNLEVEMPTKSSSARIVTQGSAELNGTESGIGK